MEGGGDEDEAAFVGGCVCGLGGCWGEEEEGEGCEKEGIHFGAELEESMRRGGRVERKREGEEMGVRNIKSVASYKLLI